MNSVPYTGILDDLSEQPIKEIIHKVLKNDCKKALDGAAHDQFNLTPLRVVPTAGTNTSAVTLTTNGTAALTNNVALGKEHVKTIIDTLKERNVPPYMEEDYYAIARPSTFRAFKNDLEGIKQYVETGFGHIQRGEIGRYEGCRFIEQTNIAAAGAGTAAAAWTNGESNWCYFMGKNFAPFADDFTEKIAA